MPIEIPQLDDRSFEQLFAEAQARIPVHTPLWTNFNDSDPGITIVQLFAFMTENLLYRSNRIPQANRLKFLTLLGIGLQPASPGQGIVAFSNDRGPIAAWPLDAGLELRAGKVPFRTRTGVCILPVTGAAYYKMPRTDLDGVTTAQYQALFQTFLDSPLDQLQFYQTMPLPAPEIGKPLPVVNLADNNATIDRSLWVALVGPSNVPVDTVRAAIAGQTLTLGIYPSPQSTGQALAPQVAESQPITDPGIVFEIAAPDPNPADPTGRSCLGPAKYTRLNIEYAENVLESPGIVQVTLPDFSKLLLWDFDPEEDGTGDYPPLIEDQNLKNRIATWVRIRLSATTDPTTTALQQQAQITWVGVNAARAIQALPIQNERLGVGTGAPDQVYKVANTPVIVDSTGSIPAPGAQPDSTFVLEVQNNDGGWDRWCMTDDLYAAGPNDQVFTLDPESGQVSFGSGLLGVRAPLGKIIRVSYEYGGGLEGKVAIGAINKCPALPGGFNVLNPLPTWGADAGENITDGERNISRYLQHRDRLVTASDFHDIAMRTPGVDMGRVEVLPLFNPLVFNPNSPAQTWPGTVTVMVIPQYDQSQPDAPIPDRLFLDAVCAWLDPRRLVTTEVYVQGPQYVPLWISIGITSRPGQVREIVQRNVMAAIRDYLSPLTGGPPVDDSSNADTACSMLPTTAGASPSGQGWPLGMEVRSQDLEAVATRVAGVRYVNSIQLGIVSGDNSAITNVDTVSLVGLQLPRVAGISAREGDAEDLSSLLGQNPAPPPNLRPVPVLPKTC